MGLVSRVVPAGQSLAAAVELAELIASFPQQCMLTDRASALHAAFDASTTYHALKHEFDHGARVLRAESVPGAQFFAQGHGRQGRVVSSAAPDKP